MENMDNELTDREFYNLKNGVMHEHFKDFTYKWGENRIYCAKVLQSGEYQWIKWSDNKGYDLNDVRRGDVIMLQKNAPQTQSDNRQNLLQSNFTNKK